MERRKVIILPLALPYWRPVVCAGHGGHSLGVPSKPAPSLMDTCSVILHGIKAHTGRFREVRRTSDRYHRQQDPSSNRCVLNIDNLKSRQGKGAGDALQSTAWVAAGAPGIHRSHLPRHRLYFVLPQSRPCQAVEIPSLGNIIFCLALAADLGANQWDGPRAKLNLCYINSPLIVPCYILLT